MFCISKFNFYLWKVHSNMDMEQYRAKRKHTEEKQNNKNAIKPRR